TPSNEVSNGGWEERTAAAAGGGAGGARERGRHLLALQGRRRPADRGRAGRDRLQRRERDVRPDELRRARGDVQGPLGRAPEVRLRGGGGGHGVADAAVRRVPADPVGVRRRPGSGARQSERRGGPDAAGEAAAAAVRRELPVLTRVRSRGGAGRTASA